MQDIIVIIPTRNRPDALAKALVSVAEQTIYPDNVIVVSDCDAPYEDQTKSVVEDIGKRIPQIKCIRNLRTKNLSGAINSALSSLIEDCICPESTFIALLDDDDSWDPDYLKACLNAADSDGFDLIVTGIIRHESENDPSTELSIPSTLSTHDFFVGNPHIQGSNLFIRLSTLLQAGGFDEFLDSTTDRDVCVRLLDLGTVKIGFVNAHFVHNWALPTQDRLSTPGSKRKTSGLQAFYWKYVSRMTTSEQEAFKTRAYDLFECLVEDSQNLNSISIEENIKKQHQSTGETKFPIIVGFMATRMDSTKNLLDDLVVFFENSDIEKSVVIYDNSHSTALLQQLVEMSTYAKLNCTIIDAETINEECEKGSYGKYFTDPENRIGIASGRTILHHILYREAKKFPGSVVWILDDDIRLDKVKENGNIEKVKHEDFQRSILGLKQQGFSIANGQVTGDAPIPVHSMLRTQLVDLLSHLKMYELGKVRFFENTGLYLEIIKKYPDYYYDYSDLHTAHLEIPFLTSAEYSQLIQRVPDIKNGINIFRPVVTMKKENKTNEEILNSIPPRGGNTIVINPECLRMFPNIAPRIGDVNLRRGDTFWCILNDRVHGYSVGLFPIAVRQERTPEAGVKFDLETLRADMYGSSFVRAMDTFFLNKIEKTGNKPGRIRLTINEEEIAAILRSFRANLKKRLIRFVENGYRIQGLCFAIENALRSPSLTHSNDKEAAFCFIKELKEKYSTENIWQFLEGTLEFKEDDLRTFLRNLHDYTKSYRSTLPLDVLPATISHAHRVVCSILNQRNGKTINELLYIGHGHEGAVFTDGIQAFKYFFAGKTNFRESRLDFIQKRLLNNHRLCHICQLLEIIEDCGELIFVMKYEEGLKYRGGYLKDILTLLEECRQERIVFTNFHPKNLIVTKDSLKLVDIGDSFVPYDEQEFVHMCRRAYLTYRWHFREDISQLMSQALFNPNLPELTGFEYFLEATQKKCKRTLLDERITDIAAEGGSCSILDFGCGRGAISEALMKKGFNVLGYDINREVLERNLSRKQKAQYMGKEELHLLKKRGKRFSKVICSLVLCTIEDDDEIKDVVSSMREFVEDDGEVIVTFCNPFSTFVHESETHVKMDFPMESSYYDKFVFRKQMKETGTIRKEVHRPFSFYKNLFHVSGLEIIQIEEIGSTDIQQLCPSSDFLICRLRPLKMPEKKAVSLLIRAGAMEWQTIDFQVRHIVKQLEGPQSFLEKVVVTDNYNGPFSRQYADADPATFWKKLDALLEEGVIDRLIVAPDDPVLIEETYRKWFGVQCCNPRCENGQPTLMSLYGIEQCRGEYVLQMDSDCLISRLDRNHDYLSEMIGVFEKDSNALSVSFNISHGDNQSYTPSMGNEKWRVEVRCSLIDRRRIFEALPVANNLNPNGALQMPWHRAMDLHIKNSKWQSYRGGDKRTFFIHVPNERKANVNEWYSIMRTVECSRVPCIQYDHPNLNGTLRDWIGNMDQDYIFIVRGRNVPIPKLRRCVDSLARQLSDTFGVIFVDAGSSNGMEEYIEERLLCEWNGKAAFFRNHQTLTPIENHDIAIRKICSNPESIIVTLDADDALIGDNIIEILEEHYRLGADLSVGSMLRTDKHVHYPAKFSHPRLVRGGNVWQHLRSFKKYLYDELPEEYLKIGSEWVPLAEDWAFMVPMVEICHKPIYITEPLYFYEPTGQKNEQSRMAREKVIHEILNKPPLSQKKDREVK